MSGEHEDVDALLAELGDTTDGSRKPRAGGRGPSIDDLLEDIGSDAEGQAKRGKRVSASKAPAAAAVAFSTYDAPPEEPPEEPAQKPPARLSALGADPAAALPAPALPVQPEQLQGGGAAPLPALRSGEPDPGDASPPRGDHPPRTRPEPPALRPQLLLRTIPCQGKAPSARWGHALVAAGGSMYVHGGMGEDGELRSDTHRLDPERVLWEAAFVASGDPPPGRYDHAGAVLGAEIFVYGGQTGGGHTAPSADCFAYDTDAQTWRQILPSEGKKAAPGHCGHSLSAHKRKLYVFGGRCPRQDKDKEEKGKEKQQRVRIQFSKDLWQLDPRAGKWKHVKPSAGAPPRARSGHASCVSQHRLWIHGGQDAESLLDDAHCFDFAAQAWREVQTAGSVPRFRHAMVSPSPGTVVVCGGATAKEAPLLQALAVDGVEVKDQGSGEDGAQQPPAAPVQWRPLRCRGAVPSTLSGCGGALAAGTLYLFGGTDQATSKAGASLRRAILTEGGGDTHDGGGAAAALPGIYAQVQADPKAAGADLKMAVNGREVHAHKWLVDARARSLLDAVKECEVDDAGAFCLDGNRRKPGVAIPNHASLAALVHYLYCARLPDDADEGGREALLALATALGITHMQDLLAGVAAGKQTKAERAALHCLEADMRDLYGAIQRRRGVRRELCDLVLEPRGLAKGHTPPRAHLSLLSAVSLPLRRALRPGAPPDPRIVVAGSQKDGCLLVQLPDTPAPALATALEFVYTGDCAVSFDAAPAVLACADVLQLAELRDAAAAAVWREMKGSLESISNVLEIADKHGAWALRELCIETLALQLPAASRTDSFCRLSPALRTAVEQVAAESDARPP
eukprot:TRINITY_DN16031_c0_g2_i1.p1 TRINITY_DN16031_c0_g2~~TRINITY_DN16031_c0_g2_i1.p1  ORF type:complete len:852 (+),score=250.35 TRINITY_DN16031_c0_g2_i1:65-2620(+)